MFKSLNDIVHEHEGTLEGEGKQLQRSNIQIFKIIYCFS